MDIPVNIFYIEIILSIIFLVSIILIGLNLKSQSNQEENSYLFQKNEKFNSIELRNFKNSTSSSSSTSTSTASDFIKIETNPLCEIVVSLEINHNITAWSPITKEKHILTNNIWPVNHISISDDGFDIILINFNKKIIYCFQNYKLKWTKIYNDLNRETKVLESFFRKKTVAGYLTRKIMKDNHKSGNFPAPPSPILAPSTLSSFTIPRATSRRPSHPQLQPPLPSLLQQQPQQQQVNKEIKHSNNDYILVLETGQIIVISCDDGTMKIENFPKLSAAAKIKTPRINDKILCKKQNGEYIIGTAINNKFIFKELKLKFINGQIPPPTQKFLNTPALIPLDFLGMIVSVQDFTASLIDVQTGVVLKTFNIGYFKAGSFKVAHSEPTHCKFCGCVSINSLSLIYKDDSGILIIHTYKIESKRSKNSICLRVERDVREIRCLGFNSINESQYWYENLKCWQVTDVNMIIGFEKINYIKINQSSLKSKLPKALTNNNLFSSSSSTVCTSSSALNQDSPKKHKQQQPNLNNHTHGLQSIRLRNVSKEKIQQEKYEGFIISLTDGKKDNYPLNNISTPNSSSYSSSSSKIVSTSKYGFKSILINFGQCFKIFYQGHNKLIENDLYYNNLNNTSGNSLLFINKRRNRSVDA
ncbi:hypothetical protein KGF54_003589 [Candida jiufengensis]|uniref:uncharacterized protein n=1 Tax=Candida jiufengensis TaxID=497108 RepID=UPI0022245396|nr:uncharacterized protein KGF54_003589 [Candida jiufengensis]KAI5952722.1 hypothetical protein KGF54_003589 [Candida jiufengensis]